MNWEIIIVIFILIICLIVFFKFNKKNVTYIKSDIDNEPYLVRDVADKQRAANMLAKIKQNIMVVVDYLYKNKDNYKDYIKYIDQLHKRIQGVIIMESTEDDQYTSYSVNKGEQLIFCLRSRSLGSTGKLHDMNLLMYVCLHEISHISSPTYGHDDQFKKVFAFLAKIGIELGLYKKIDFGKKSETYCGLEITDSII